MVVYNFNLGAYMYRMWNLIKDRIHNSSDIIWLKRVYYPRTSNAPLIYLPTFRDIEVWKGIGVINTKTTANYIQDDENASEDEEYSDISDLAVKPKIECDCDEESDDE